MYNISSIYQNEKGAKFNLEYYLNVHMPMSVDLLSSAKGFEGVSVEIGVDVENPKIESSFIAMCHYYFDTLENFIAAFMPHADKLQGDLSNYSSIEPIIQVNKVEMSKLKNT